MKTDPLQSHLQDEAGNSAPAFSPLLHERIMAQLRANPAAAAQTPARSRMLWPLAAAAAIAIAASAYFALRGNSVPPAPAPANIAVSLPTPNDLTQPVATLLASAADPIEKARYAYLDQDAKRLLLFVADQFPTPPSLEKTPQKSAPIH